MLQILLVYFSFSIYYRMELPVLKLEEENYSCKNFIDSAERPALHFDQHNNQLYSLQQELTWTVERIWQNHVGNETVTLLQCNQLAVWQLCHNSMVRINVWPKMFGNNEIIVFFYHSYPVVNIVGIGWFEIDVMFFFLFWLKLHISEILFLLLFFTNQYKLLTFINVLFYYCTGCAACDALLS